MSTIYLFDIKKIYFQKHLTTTCPSQYNKTIINTISIDRGDNMDINSNTVNIQQNITLSDFQNLVDDVLIRHKSVLDITTKLDEYTTRINRAVVKSVTSCGCIEIHATKQDYNKESLQEMKKSMSNHIKGELCPNCKEIIIQEIGAYLFYLSALCNALDINLADSFINEYKNMKALGIFSLK